jgi:surface polysaccharide O-acyltransferase-like enzyme
MGWYIINAEIRKSSRIKIYICGFSGYLATVVCTQLFYDNTESRNNFFYNNGSLTAFLYSTAVFIFLLNLLKGKQFAASAAVLKLSGLTFGVYLIHPVFLYGLKIIFSGIGPAPLDTLVIFISAAILSFLSVFVISKIPMVKKAVGG